MAGHTILELNCYGFVRAFHEEPVDTGRISSALCEEALGDGVQQGAVVAFGEALPDELHLNF